MTTPRWREFEQLVARIEKTVAGSDVRVKSPDRIADLVTGTLREVDASIQYNIGTVPVLITVECRRRKNREDVRWIEQLKGKRESIGAARTIAVSWTGFSKEAEDAARRSGVELRHLEDVDREDIQSWLAPTSVFHIFRKSRLVGEIGIAFRLKAGDNKDITLAPDMEAASKHHGYNAKLFTRTDENTLMSLNDIWLLAQAQNDYYVELRDLPLGSRICPRLTLEIPKSALTIMMTVGSREVEQIVLEMELWHEVEEVPLDEGSFHRYSDSAAMEIHRAEFSITLRNLDVTMAFQGEKESSEIRFESSVKKNAPHH